MAKLIVWSNRRKIKDLLARRLKAAKTTRREQVEQEWRLARACVFGDDYSQSSATTQALGQDTEDFDMGDRIEVAYAFRNLRLIHSHMSSNPPVATARAQSTDLEDRRAAKAAQHVMRWFLQKLGLHNVNDLSNLDTLTVGTGVTRTGYNPDGGEPLKFDPKTCEMETDGAIEIERVPIDNFWVDANAKSDTEIRHTFELRQFTGEEIRSRWPEKWGLIRKVAAHKSNSSVNASTTMGTETEVYNPEAEPLYDLYWYFEPGFPENGFLGRFVIHAEDGTLIEGPDINPNLSYPPPPLAERRRAAAKGKKLKRRPPTAYLPYQITTDIDVPDRFWGRSALYYVAPAQRLMTNLDSATLEAVKAHGVLRLMLPAGAKLSKEALSNTSVEAIQMEEDSTNPNADIKFIAPGGLPQAMPELRGLMRQGIDDMWGVNENMFGNQSREQSAVNMQYAVNQGVMVRRRLFNKSIRTVQNQYKALLSLAIQHWDTPRALAVLGEEKAYSVEEFMNMDLYCGYEIDVEYGTHLPLDPMARRDELLKYMPIFEKAGIATRSLASAIGMADLEYVQEIGDLSRDRAEEAVDAIITKGIQVPAASKYQDHEGMLAYLLEYVNTSSFDRLPAERRALIDDHIAMRTQLAAETRTAAGAGGAPAPAPAPGGATPEQLGAAGAAPDLAAAAGGMAPAQSPPEVPPA